MLYESAAAYSCLEGKGDTNLRESISTELRRMVEISRSDVLDSDAPFRALAHVGEAEYLLGYSCDQEKYSAVNRFHAYKYWFPAVDFEQFERAMDRPSACTDRPEGRDARYGQLRQSDTR